jgi:hypothetical protein
MSDSVLVVSVRPELADLVKTPSPKEEAFLDAIGQSKSGILLSHKDETLLLLRGKSGDPILNSMHPGPSRGYNWRLNEDPNTWGFIPDPVFANGQGNSPNNWDWTAAYWELLYLVPNLPEFGSLKHHYWYLAVWLLFDALPDGEGKDELRSFLWETDLIRMKPFADLAKAQREFVSQIFPLSELAQRARGEVSLWFVLQWSELLLKCNAPNTSKTAHRESFSEDLKGLRESLKRANSDGESINPYLPEELGGDWRMYIETSLIYEAINLVANTDADSLYSICKAYLEAKSRHLTAVGRKRGYDIDHLPPDPKRPGPPIGRKRR